MIDERILKFLHDWNLELVGIDLGLQTLKVSVTLRKSGGSLIVGKVRKGVHGAEEDLLSCLRVALSEAKIASDLDICLGLNVLNEARV